MFIKIGMNSKWVRVIVAIVVVQMWVVGMVAMRERVRRNLQIFAKSFAMR